MQTALLLSVVAPGVTIAILLGLGAATRRSQGGLASVLGAFMAPVAAFAAYVPVRGVPELPPGDASVWSLWMGWGASLISALGAGAWFPKGLRWSMLAAWAAATAYLVAGPLLQGSGFGTCALLVFGTTAGVFAVGWTLETRASLLPGPALALSLSVLSGGAATVLGTSGTALLAQVAGGGSVAWGVLFLFTLWRRELPFRLAMGPSMLLLGGLLLGGSCYAEVGVPAVLVLSAGAFLLGVLPLKGALRSPMLSALILASTAAVASLAAVASGFLPAPQAESTLSEEDDHDGYDY
ncbi:MAG: hypothetical protein AAF627_07270 [Myxococcota bacterium]